MRLSILTFVALAALAVACSGGAASETVDGLTVIKPLDLSGVDLSIADTVDPSVANPYPDVVATVNGEEITGEALVEQQINSELGRRSIATLDESFQQQMSSPDTDPLEKMIGDVLAKQAVERLGLLPSHDDALDYTRTLEDQFKHPQGVVEPGSEETIRELFDARGWSYNDWASNEDLVEGYRQGMGLSALHAQECTVVRTPQTQSPFNMVTSQDCTDFLAKERENADIVYFVRWAD